MTTRLPLLADDQAGPPELVAAMRARRGGALIELDRLLLHSPPFAAGWNTMLGQVRTALALPALYRELAMCGVAVLNGAAYELHQHAPLYLAAGGTDAQLAALARLADDATAVDDPAFDAVQRALLPLVVQMTLQVRVDDAVFEAARAALPDERQLFELVGVTAAYNMVSRVLVALQLAP